MHFYISKANVVVRGGGLGVGGGDEFEDALWYIILYFQCWLQYSGHPPSLANLTSFLRLAMMHLITSHLYYQIIHTVQHALTSQRKKCKKSEMLICVHNCTCMT